MRGDEQRGEERGAREDARDQPRPYRRLGLYVAARIELRKALARFWARGDASQSIDRSMRPQIERRPLEDLE